MQIKNVAKKIADHFVNADVNAIVRPDYQMVVCMVEDYDHAINIIKTITDIVYMTEHDDIVTCVVDDVIVAITNGTLNLSTDNIYGFAAASLNRVVKYPEYTGIRNVYDAIRTEIVIKFAKNNVVSWVYRVDNVILCFVDDHDAAYQAVSDKARDFVHTNSPYIIAGFVGVVVVGIIKRDGTTLTLGNDREIKSVIMDAISKRGELKAFVPSADSGQPATDPVIKDAPLHRIKQVKETLVEAFNDNNISSTIVYDDICVVCYVEDVESALQAIKDLTRCIYTTADSNVFACRMDDAAVAIVNGTATNDIKPVYKLIKRVLRTSFLPITLPVDDVVEENVSFVKALSSSGQLDIPVSPVTIVGVGHNAMPKKTEGLPILNEQLMTCVSDNSPYIDELAKNLMKEPIIKKFVDRLAALTPEERAEILATKESTKQVETYLKLKLATSKVGHHVDERNGYLSCKVDDFSHLVQAGIIDSVDQLNDTTYDTIKYVTFNDVMVVFAGVHPEDEGRYLDDDMYRAICQAGINFIIKSRPTSTGPVSYIKEHADVDNGAIVQTADEDIAKSETKTDMQEKQRPKGRYNLFCTAYLNLENPGQYGRSLFNHRCNLGTGDTLNKAINKLVGMYMYHYNMACIPSLYAQGLVKSTDSTVALYEMSPIGAIIWKREHLLNMPTCHEIGYTSTQYVSEPAKRVREEILLDHIQDNRRFKIAIHVNHFGIGGKPIYVMNIFEILEDNKEPYIGDVYEYLMEHLSN